MDWSWQTGLLEAAQLHKHAYPLLQTPTPCACAARRRHRLVALVCRRWHRLASSSPLLLRSVSVCIPDTPAFMRRLRSLCQWLVQRAAPHMLKVQRWSGAMKTATTGGWTSPRPWRLRWQPAAFTAA